MLKHIDPFFAQKEDHSGTLLLFYAHLKTSNIISIKQYKFLGNNWNV